MDSTKQLNQEDEHFQNFFSGIGLVIDDEIGQKGADITGIINNLEKNNIPLVKYTEIPDEKIIPHLGEISFIILDWKLSREVPTPMGTPELSKSNNPLTLIKMVKDKIYIPIFIFSMSPKDDIKNEIEEEFEKVPKNILITEKTKLPSWKEIQNTMIDCVKKNPSVYVLQKWKEQYTKSRNKTFLDLIDISLEWPSVLYDAYNKDGENPTHAIGDLINRKIINQMLPYKFEEDILKLPKSEINDVNEKIEVMYFDRFIEYEEEYRKCKKTYPVSTGDLFRFGKTETETETEYWLNVRAQCDIAHKPNPEIYIYIIKGKEIFTTAEKKKSYATQYKFRLNEKTILFDCREIKISEFDTLIEEEYVRRIGRITPPYITDIQQKFAAVIHRVGLPKDIV